ncbi:DDE-type integrase/transposase/recombinase [Streptococcus pluranimalium]
MTSIPQNLRYLPHTLETRYHAVKTYRNGASVAFICRRYKVSKASLMRWNKRFDGTKESLKDKSHRPLTPHPNSHTKQELTWIKNCIRRNPNATLIEIFYKLKTNKGYDRHPCSLFRVLRKMDVKYIPKHCYTGRLPDKFYQYTVIDEASRERFIFPFKEQSSHSTVQFVMMAIKYFGYKPKIIQTDNGFEFTHFRETKQVHPLDILCQEMGIEHKLIRPRTPRHNGKVERSHRNDNRRFYQHLAFYSYNNLIKQMKTYLYRSNRLPMQTLGWKSPIDIRKTLLGPSS